MNFTRDFHEYVNIVKNTYVSKFHFKCEKYNPLDKCTMILRQMIEVEKNIDSLKTGKKLYLVFSMLFFLPEHILLKEKKNFFAIY